MRGAFLATAPYRSWSRRLHPFLVRTGRCAKRRGVGSYNLGQGCRRGSHVAKALAPVLYLLVASGKAQHHFVVEAPWQVINGLQFEPSSLHTRSQVQEAVELPVTPSPGRSGVRTIIPVTPICLAKLSFSSATSWIAPKAGFIFVLLSWFNYSSSIV